jgi:hypothetical protein
MIWLRQEFSWSEETARKFIKVAEAFQQDGNEYGISFIDVSALYVLSKPDVPETLPGLRFASGEWNAHRWRTIRNRTADG